MVMHNISDNLLILTNDWNVIEVLELIELMTWHQLYAVNPQFLKTQKKMLASCNLHYICSKKKTVGTLRWSSFCVALA